VTSELAAKKLVCAQSVVNGQGRISAALPKPQAVRRFYRDIAVLTVPTPDTWIAGCTVVAGSQFENYGPALAENGKVETRWISNGNKPGMGPTPAKPDFLQFTLGTPFAAAAIRLNPHRKCGPQEVEVQCSDDGKTVRARKRGARQLRGRIALPAADPTRRSWAIQGAHVIEHRNSRVGTGAGVTGPEPESV
jgi:hypothetical protein